ncbi:MAG: hypothetical protein QNK43_06340 [Amphritea sp.]|nr:hypothetical protein [Amphritea sp.]
MKQQEKDMSNIVKGIVAGFAATVVLSLLMMAKSMMGLMPEMNIIAMLGGMMGAGVAVGWVTHVLIGSVVWGAGFAMLNGTIPGTSLLTKGIVFGVVAWVLMMILVMPMAGAGLFGMNLGIMAPMMTLVLHIIFGAVLGGVFSIQPNSESSTKIAKKSTVK